MKESKHDLQRRGFLRTSLGMAGGLALALPVLSGCEETIVNLQGPIVPIVDNELTLDTSTAEFSALATIGTLVSVNTEHNGASLKLMVFRISENEANTMTRVCTHVGCDLGLIGGSGELFDADTVQCGCHGSRFNLATGALERGVISGQEDLRTYATTIEGNIITIQLA